MHRIRLIGVLGNFNPKNPLTIPFGFFCVFAKKKFLLKIAWLGARSVKNILKCQSDPNIPPRIQEKYFRIQEKYFSRNMIPSRFHPCWTHLIGMKFGIQVHFYVPHNISCTLGWSGMFQSGYSICLLGTCILTLFWCHQGLILVRLIWSGWNLASRFMLRSHTIFHEHLVDWLWGWLKISKT
jgi:hypothetical protein